jgi:pimeloyl-ACP methyl ester carboxylesterase
MTNHTVNTTHGTILYQDIGAGLPILFLHGSLANGNTWRKIIEPLSQHFRCIAPTLPLGAHEIPIHANQPMTGDVIAQIIDDLIAHLGLGQVILLANDTGGAYAQVFTAQYPDKVSHLILTNCDAFEVFPPKAFNALKTFINTPFLTDIMAKLFRLKPVIKSQLTLGMLSNTLTGKQLQQYYLDHFMHSRAIRDDFKQLVMGWNAQDTLNAAQKLKHFDKPVLVLWGEDDEKLFPLELGQRLADLFPNTRFIKVAKSSTFIQEDNPQALIEQVRLFLIPPVTPEHQL